MYEKSPITGCDDRPHYGELMHTLSLIRESNAPAYASMKLTISRVAAMVLIQDTEDAYLRRNTRVFDIYELEREQFPRFCRYLDIPAHEARYTLVIRKESEFAAVYAADWNTGFIYRREYIHSARTILDLLDTFEPWLVAIGSGDGPKGGETNES